MAIDWDAFVLTPLMRMFGEGGERDPASLPTYLPAGAAPFALADAVFDAYYHHTTLDAGDQPVTTIKPVLGVRLARFTEACAPPPAQGDQVYVPSVNQSYIVVDVQPDGHGHAKLILMVPE